MTEIDIDGVYLVLRSTRSIDAAAGDHITADQTADPQAMLHKDLDLKPADIEQLIRIGAIVRIGDVTPAHTEAPPALQLVR